MDHKQLARAGMLWALALTSIACWILVVSLRADERLVAPVLAPVTGVSMLPYFRAGSFVFIQPCEFRLVSVGQPIVYFESARRINVLHTVVAVRETKNGRGLVTKGAANLERDPHLATKENFVGCVELPK